MEKEGLPDDALFFVADGHYSVDQVFSAIYGHSTTAAKQYFIRVNSHLVGGAVRPGQIVIITPPNSSTCQKWEVVMQETVRIHESELLALTEREKRILAKNYAFLSDVAGYSSPMYGWANGYFAQKTKLVERILDQMDRLYQSSYRTHGHLKSDYFFAQRRALFSQLDQAVNGMVRRELFGSSAKVSKIKRQLGISSKAVAHQWNMNGQISSVGQLQKNYQTLIKVSKTFSRLGYVAIGVEVMGGVANIAEVCTSLPGSADCAKTKFTETGKVTGSIGGGMLGGSAAAYGTCNLLFGLESAGTSLLWCAVVAGAVGAYGGSKYGGKLGETTGRVIYEVNAR